MVCLFKFLVAAIHSAGVQNVAADALSRLSEDKRHSGRSLEDYHCQFPGPVLPNTPLLWDEHIHPFVTACRPHAFYPWPIQLKKTRQPQWIRFLKFCEKFDRRPLPASTETICLYISYLSRKHEFSTVSNYVSRLAPFHHFSEYDGPGSIHFSIRQALASLQRISIKLLHERSPVSPKDLYVIYRNLRASSKKYRKTVWASCLVAFYSLLRSATYVIENTPGFFYANVMWNS